MVRVVPEITTQRLLREMIRGRGGVTFKERRVRDGGWNRLSEFRDAAALLL